MARALSDPRLCPQQRVMTTDMSSTLSATEALSPLPALSCRPSRVGLKKLELQISPTEPESVLTILARGNHDPLTNPPLIKVFDVNYGLTLLINLNILAWNFSPYKTQCPQKEQRKQESERAPRGTPGSCKGQCPLPAWTEKTF